MIFMSAMIFLAGILLGAAPQSSYQKYFNECLSDQVKLYDDLCAESSSGYEEMTGIEAHQEGALCAVESIQMCMEAK